ncbi:hypothetical protein [Catellatospora tritici]|uniref:hypothetical protein n=1 Tax=Catellatospora tritici TaxID=2851566 RepID=UPI001C2DBADD|nr:hypothetical protein [Catellatospora tritici]MBV1856757.1 hypothetical protein [Catellatospora tritici]
MVDTIFPSTDCELYDNATDGPPPPGTGGTAIGYEYSNPPEFPPTDHEPLGANDVAV